MDSTINILLPAVKAKAEHWEWKNRLIVGFCWVITAVISSATFNRATKDEMLIMVLNMELSNE